MKALILNSGMGKRMGVLTTEHPKCMTEITKGETILSRQLKLLQKYGIKEVIVTTGLFDDVLMKYCRSLNLSLRIVFVKNPLYDRTNYIYSIYLARQYLNSDLLLMHGDLVFADEVLQKLIKQPYSCMTVSSTLPLPVKDFKAVLRHNKIIKIGIDFYKDAMAAQPLYRLKHSDWKVWLERIIEFCQQNRVDCYAENAFNEVSSRCQLYPFDVKDRLCSEIDTPEDLAVVKEKLADLYGK
jgi:phosphoenolpyruvate phosphomutase